MAYFNGFLVQNSSVNRHLISNACPHHNCSNGNEHTEYTGPMDSSACMGMYHRFQDRDFYLRILNQLLGFEFRSHHKLDDDTLVVFMIC